MEGIAFRKGWHRLPSDPPLTSRCLRGLRPPRVGHVDFLARMLVEDVSDDDVKVFEIRCSPRKSLLRRFWSLTEYHNTSSESLAVQACTV